MSQKLPDILITHMRDLIESAPDSVRPLVTRAAAMFLKREEPRWGRLSIDHSFLEERFYNFLNAPSTYDMIIEDLVPAIDVGRPLGGTQAKAVAEAPLSWENPWPRTPLQHTAKTIPLGYSGNEDKYKVCWDCEGSGIDGGHKCIECQGTGLVLKEGLGEAAEDWKETRCDVCKGLPDGLCRACGGKGWFWQSTSGVKDLGYGNPVRFGRVNENRECPVCDGQGWVWDHPEPGEDVMLTKIDCPHCHGTGTLKEDAPAMAAGNGAIAGIGQPEGSAFGEPGGATTKTRKKNKRPDDLTETEYVWVCRGCDKIYGPADGVPKKCPRCGSTEADSRDDSELDEETDGGNFPPNPFEKLLRSYKFVMKSSGVEPNQFARDNRSADVLKSIWVRPYPSTQPDFGKSRIEVWQYRDGKKTFISRFEQSNGIMSPSTGETKGQLEKTLTGRYDWGLSLNEGNASDLIPKSVGDRPKKLPSEHHYDTMLGWVEKDKQRITKLTALLSTEKDPLTLAPIKASLAHAKQELAQHEQELAKIGGEIERYRADRAAGIKRGGKSPLEEARKVKIVLCSTGGGIDVHAPGCADIAKQTRKGGIQNSWAETVTAGNLTSIQKQAVDLMNASFGYDPKYDDSPPWGTGSVRVLPCCGVLKEEREKFAGGDVFEVDMDRWMTSRFGKNRYHRYSRYVGSDKVGEEIRTHGRSTKNDIVLKDQTTGVMTYLRRKKQIG